MKRNQLVLSVIFSVFFRTLVTLGLTVSIFVLGLTNTTAAENLKNPRIISFEVSTKLVDNVFYAESKVIVEVPKNELLTSWSTYYLSSTPLPKTNCWIPFTSQNDLLSLGGQPALVGTFNWSKPNFVKTSFADRDRLEGTSTYRSEIDSAKDVPWCDGIYFPLKVNFYIGGWPWSFSNSDYGKTGGFDAICPSIGNCLANWQLSASKWDRLSGYDECEVIANSNRSYQNCLGDLKNFRPFALTRDEVLTQYKVSILKKYPAASASPSVLPKPVLPSVNSPTTSTSPAPTKITITCVKGKLTKKVTAIKPSCPAGYKKK